VGFKGFGLSSGSLGTEGAFEYEGKQFSLKHGSVVIAAITSCTNTSNPSVMLGAGTFFSFPIIFLLERPTFLLTLILHYNFFQ